MSIPNSTTPTHGLNIEEQTSNKRLRVDGGSVGESIAYLPTSSYNPASSSSSAATSISTNLNPPNTLADITSSSTATSTSTGAVGPAPVAGSTAPLPIPLSPLLSQTPPAWMAEVPACIEAVQQHEPTIPDEVVQYLLERSGCNVTDPKLIRLVSIATQHFLYDVMHDARQYHKLRSKDSKDKTNSELTLPDLASSLESHGINLSKPDYYADSVFAGGMLNVNAAVQPTQANLQASQAAKGESKQAKKK